MKIELSCFFLCILFFIGCGGSNNTNNTPTTIKKLVSYETLMSKNLSGTDVNVTYIKLNYKTTNEDGTPVVASGLLSIPKKNSANLSTNLIINAHGTIFKNSYAPSEINNTTELDIFIVQNYNQSGNTTLSIIIEPDYIGYGASIDLSHPYLLYKSSANAALDMLDASLEFLSQKSYSHTGKLVITGFSQGGYTALALGHHIHNSSQSNQFTLKGIAPASGPYDLEYTANALIGNNTIIAEPALLLFVLNSYANAYNIELNTTFLRNDINITSFKSLFIGGNTSNEIDSFLNLKHYDNISGNITSQFLSPTFINDFNMSNSNSDGLTLRQALQENSIYKQIIPSSNINFFYCSQDLISITNVPLVVQDIESRNSGGYDINHTDVNSITSGAYSHYDCYTSHKNKLHEWINNQLQ